MTAAPAHPKAFAVWFKDLHRWSVSSFFRIRWNWPSNVIRPLSDALERKWLPVNRSNVTLNQLQLVTLHFDGEMEPRDMRGTADFKGKLFYAEAGEVIYSKIDVRNGAIGVVPPDLPKIAVSSEYPVYRVRPEVALPDYVKLLFRTSAFRQQINSMISGASGRKRAQPSDLEEVRVPFPSLLVQEASVSRWRGAQEAAARSREIVAKLEAEIPLDIYKTLGLKPPRTDRHLPKAFALWWKHLERWSVEYVARMLAGMNSADKGKHPVLALSRLVEGQSGGTPSTKRKDYWGGKIPWVSPKDMKTLEIRDTEDHITEVAVKEGAASLLSKDAVLVVVRSGILQRSVPVAIARVPVAINQDLRAFTVKDQSLNPEFLLHYLNARQDHLLRLVKYSTTVQSMNKDELEAFPVPVPPLDVQCEIVDMVNRERRHIAEERKAADERLAQAAREVEEMILGARPVN